jgi:hypothetical protein
MITEYPGSLLKSVILIILLQDITCGCGLTSYDKHALLEIAREQLLIIRDDEPALNSTVVFCKEISGFKALNINFEGVVLLDNARTFRRWSFGRIPPRGIPEDAIKVLVEGYLSSSLFQLAREFGRGRISEAERSQLIALGDKSVLWSRLNARDLMGRHYEGQNLGDDESDSIQSFMSFMINGYVLSNFDGAKLSLPAEKTCGPVTTLSSFCDCQVLVRDGGGRSQMMRLRVPVNPGRYPFVGWPEKAFLGSTP